MGKHTFWTASFQSLAKSLVGRMSCSLLQYRQFWRSWWIPGSFVDIHVLQILGIINVDSIYYCQYQKWLSLLTSALHMLYIYICAFDYVPKFLDKEKRCIV